MLELKEEYRTYTLAVKKILNEYNAMREQAAGTTEFAQDCAATDAKDPFMVVNREPTYLKESMINYIRQENLDFVLKSVDPNEWSDYSDQIGKKASPAQVAKQRIKKTRLTKKNTAPAPAFHDTYLSAAKDISFAWPIDRAQFWLSSFFGPRRKPDRSWGFHYGIDMAACKGTPVFAAHEGVIIEAHFDAGYGNTLLISHNNKYKTRYAHLDKMLVSVGQKVHKGMLIGKVGATGAVFKKKGRDASHLHFEVYAYGKKINPLSFFV